MLVWEDLKRKKRVVRIHTLETEYKLVYIFQLL